MKDFFTARQAHGMLSAGPHSWVGSGAVLASGKEVVLSPTVVPYAGFRFHRISIDVVVKYSTFYFPSFVVTICSLSDIGDELIGGPERVHEAALEDGADGDSLIMDQKDGSFVWYFFTLFLSKYL